MSHPNKSEGGHVSSAEFCAENVIRFGCARLHSLKSQERSLTPQVEMWVISRIVGLRIVGVCRM